MKASIHRPTYIEVDLSAISYNLGQVVAQLPAQTQVFAVVKANAYGHGVLPVAKTLLDQVDGFCVSNIDEEPALLTGADLDAFLKEDFAMREAMLKK